MDFIDHIHRCNRHDIGGFRPFLVEGRKVGWIRHRHTDALMRFPTIFVVTPDAVNLDPALTGFAERTEAVAGALVTLAEDGRFPKLRGEMFSVIEHFNAPPLFEIDRAATPYFGVINAGFHLNGIVRDPSGDRSLDRMWVARRAAAKTTYPNKLDNVVAGGHPSGISFAENVVKECAEEAGIPPDLARRAQPAGVMTYAMEVESGIRRDGMLVYDLDIPPDFEPVPVDGEVGEFLLMPVPEVMATVQNELDAFKYNCNLVVIDWLMRSGWISPDHPDYLDLSRGLRAPWP
jgi:8-oxo-dGTP pyrophosphatase MutT (NUDIX family)